MIIVTVTFGNIWTIPPRDQLHRGYRSSGKYHDDVSKPLTQNIKMAAPVIRPAVDDTNSDNQSKCTLRGWRQRWASDDSYQQVIDLSKKTFQRRDNLDPKILEEHGQRSTLGFLTTGITSRTSTYLCCERKAQYLRFQRTRMSGNEKTVSQLSSQRSAVHNCRLSRSSGTEFFLQMARSSTKQHPRRLIGS